MEAGEHLPDLDDDTQRRPQPSGRPQLGLRVQTERQDAGAVVTVAGELDVATVPQLREALDELLGEPAARLVLDLADVTFVDSTGLRALLDLQRSLREAGGTLTLIAGPVTNELLDLAGVRELFDEVRAS